MADRGSDIRPPGCGAAGGCRPTGRARSPWAARAAACRPGPDRHLHPAGHRRRGRAAARPRAPRDRRPARRARRAQLRGRPRPHPGLAERPRSRSRSRWARCGGRSTAGCASFTRGAMHERSLSGVGYVLHVADSRRAPPSSAATASGSRRRARAAPRRAAPPTTSLTAAVARGGDPDAAVGVDYGADPYQAALFGRAVGTGRPQASPPRRSPFSGRSVVVVMVPVFRADRPARTPPSAGARCAGSSPGCTRPAS